MSRRICGLILILALTVAVATAVNAQENTELNFTLYNRTGVTIYTLQMSPSQVDDWQEDMLGEGVMESGTARAITFRNYRSNVELWDLRVTDSEGTAIVWYGLDLTQFYTLTLVIEDGKALAYKDVEETE